jgi:hypothetical protein
MSAVGRMSSMAFPVAIAILATAPTPAGHVVTPRERISGTVIVRDGGFAIDVGSGAVRTVPVDDVLYALAGGRLQRARGPEEIRLRSGEVLPGRAERLQSRELEVASALFGPVKIGQSLLAEIAFAPESAAEAEVRAGWLYRKAGEPTPGTVLWMDEARLGMESPLGVLTLKRDGLSRYVFSATPLDPSAGRGSHEISLGDGNVIRGDLSVGAERVRILHPRFGTRDVPPSALVALVRSDPRLLDLAVTQPHSVEMVALLGGAPRRGGLRALRSPADSASTAPTFVKGLRVEAGTEVRFALGAGSGQLRKLRALLAPAEGSRGDCRVKIRVGVSECLERDLRKDTEPEWLELELPWEGDLTIRVDHGHLLRFPCAAVLGDPHVLDGAMESGEKKEGESGEKER